MIFNILKYRYMSDTTEKDFAAKIIAYVDTIYPNANSGGYVSDEEIEYFNGTVFVLIMRLGQVEKVQELMKKYNKSFQDMTIFELVDPNNEDSPSMIHTVSTYYHRLATPIQDITVDDIIADFEYTRHLDENEQVFTFM